MRSRVMPNSCEEIEREIDASAFGVFFDVAEDVGELEGYAGLFGELFGAGIGVAEDADADQADDRGYEVAVAVEVFEGGEGLGSRLRLRVECRGPSWFPGPALRGGCRGCRSACWVSLRARKTGSSVAAGGAGDAPGVDPGGHVGAAGVDGHGFVVGDVVGAAHEGVDGAHGVALVLGQDAEGAVEVLGLALGYGTADTCRLRAVVTRWQLPRASLLEERAGEEPELLCLGDYGAAAEDVVVLRGDAVEDGFAALAEEVEGDGSSLSTCSLMVPPSRSMSRVRIDEAFASWRGTRG